MISEEKLKAYIKQGIENNTLVFDDNTNRQAGDITRRFLFFLAKHFEAKFTGRLHQIFIPFFTYPLDVDLKQAYFGISSYIELRGLDADGDLLKYYKEENGSLPKHCCALVLAVDAEENVILGAL